jgi:hypothetical protein
MDAARRRGVEQYVRPIAVGLDGVTYFGDAERVVRAAERIAAEMGTLDRDLLYLLAMFSGQEKWVSRMGHRSRTEIFLASLRVSQSATRALFRGLSRFDTDPKTPEEEVVHDAVRLEGLGATGIARRLIEGYRERQDFLEMADAIEEAARKPLRTESGRALAEPRRETMRQFAATLREEYRDFGREAARAAPG